ncbi:MAG: deiodinase-like protein [Planctomycetaceae bacterium]
MKTILRTWITLCVVGTVSTAPAWGGQRESGRRDADRPPGRSTQDRQNADARTTQLEFDPQALLDVLDDDRDGEISRDELFGFLERLDRNGDQSVSLQELKAVGPFARDHTLLSRESLANRLRRFEDFHLRKPAPGDLAPPFELRDLDGAIVSLADLLKTKPVVIETGSYTCPVFRGRHASIEQLAAEFADKVHLVVLYGREAHPDYGRFAGISQPSRTEDRIKLAADAARELTIGVPVLVDDVDNKVLEAYGALPNCGLIVGQDGRVFYKLSWIHPKLLRTPLEALLQLGGSGGASPPSFPVGGTHPGDSERPRQAVPSNTDLSKFRDAPLSVPNNQERQIAWLEADLEQARTTAKGAGVPVLAEFHFDGCPICAAMELTTLQDQLVVAASRKFVPVKIDLTGEEGKKLGEQLDIVGTPTFVIFNSSGDVVARHEGPAEPSEFTAFLRTGLTRSAP